MLALAKSSRSTAVFILVLAALLGACSAGGGEAETPTAVAQAAPTSLPASPEDEPTSPPLEPTETARPPTDTPEAPTATVEPTATPEPTEPAETPTPEPTIELSPIIPIGSAADFTASNDIAGIEGRAEVIDANKIRISDFVSLVAAAPGVDIRLGQGRDFSDEVAVVLKDITGDTYEGRSLTLTIPSSAFDGRTFDSIAVFCFATGEIFDWVMFEDQGAS